MKKLIVLVFLLTSLFVSPSLSSAEGTWKKIKPNLDINKNESILAIQLKDGRVMVIGNKNSSIYNFKTNKWSKAAPTILKGDIKSPVLLQDGQVLVFTGFRSSGTFYERAEIYNPKTNKWKLAGKHNNLRGALVGAVVLPNGKVMIAGGTYSKKGDVEIYNPKTNKWSTAADMNYHWDSGGSFLPLKDGKILALGGTVRTGYTGDPFVGGYAKTVLEIYDYKTNKWTVHEINSDFNVDEKLFYLSDGTIFFIGQYDTAVYDFETKKFKQLTQYEFDGVDGVELNNGKVLLTGFYEPTYEKYKPKGYLYTIKTKKLEKINMPPIISPYLFKLPNGKILALSTEKRKGLTGITDWNTMYLYTPSK